MVIFNFLKIIKNEIKEVREGDQKYLAPEVLQDINNITCAADIFSLGMTILELATDLDLPQRGDPWHQLRNGQIPSHLINSLNQNLVDIIMKMIEPDHLKRANAEQLLKTKSIQKIRFRKKLQSLNLRLFTFSQKIFLIFVYGISLLAYIVTCPWPKLKELFEFAFGKPIVEENNLNDSNPYEDKKQTSTPKKSLFESLPSVLASADKSNDSKSNKSIFIKELSFLQVNYLGVQYQKYIDIKNQKILQI